MVYRFFDCAVDMGWVTAELDSGSAYFGSGEKPDGAGGTMTWQSGRTLLTAVFACQHRINGVVYVLGIQPFTLA